MHRTPGNPHIDHNIYHKMSLASRIERHTSRWVFPPGSLELNQQMWKYSMDEEGHLGSQTLGNVIMS